ncbi:hypothetical protein ACBG90_08210 [Stutzerimonas kunmingensis]|uniref:Uncharacterized protein n=1 Tax=Stutzerimonas stutzeri TaxID=316 RepID=A0A4S2B422_STUST|nr:hypothetical protein [Stutzerimonas stutzeri]MBI8362353.1 hypothetical protein [Pseudomonas aeruginosa]NMY66020.1 hypothetical protein [Pseudomonas sp. WS 5018]MCF0017074.1 hypothetical protein [Stutzerimonas stutzeri]MCF0018760.1 hypothetical protein [Stutzerimonas stutzeri]MDH0104044.1 hypothetical protein [Stutzerimonas stutzeri]
MLLKEAQVKIPRAIGIGLIVYFGLVVQGREVVNRADPVVHVKAVETEIPVPPVYSPEVSYEQN